MLTALILVDVYAPDIHCGDVIADERSNVRTSAITIVVLSPTRRPVRLDILKTPVSANH